MGRQNKRLFVSLLSPALIRIVNDIVLSLLLVPLLNYQKCTQHCSTGEKGLGKHVSPHNKPCTLKANYILGGQCNSLNTLIQLIITCLVNELPSYVEVLLFQQLPSSFCLCLLSSVLCSFQAGFFFCTVLSDRSFFFFF